MGSANTKNAVSRTAITIMEGNMSWDELYKELAPKIPFDRAKTVKQAAAEINEGKEQHEKVSDNHVRETLERKCDNEGWTKARFKSSAWYWPPE